ncbi:MAG: hypothetical protein OXF56_05870 [Rhodobacteraceae bacterium]|nr:hypothetical protein [Paracoccaceae bacterium]
MLRTIIIAAVFITSIGQGASAESANRYMLFNECAPISFILYIDGAHTHENLIRSEVEGVVELKLRAAQILHDDDSGFAPGSLGFLGMGIHAVSVKDVGHAYFVTTEMIKYVTDMASGESNIANTWRHNGTALGGIPELKAEVVDAANTFIAQYLVVNSPAC